MSDERTLFATARTQARWSTVAALALALALAATMLWQAFSQRENALATAELRSQAQARFLAGHASQALEEGDMALSNLRSEIERHDVALGAGTLSADLRDHLKHLPHARDIQVYDAQGRLVNSARRLPLPADQPVPAHVVAHLAVPVDFSITQADRGDIALSRPLLGPDGAARGVLVLLLPSSHFADYYASDVSGDMDEVMLLQPEAGEPLLSWRRPGAQPVLLSRLSSLPVLAGSHVSRKDGAILAAFQLPGFPLRLAMVKQTAPVLAAWEKQAVFPLLAAVMVLAVAGLFVAINLTRHRQLAGLQGALAESENRYRAIFENALAGILQTDASGRILRTNTALTQMLGYEPGELVGWQVLDMVHAEDRPETARLQADMNAGVIPSYVQEKRYLTKSGGELWVKTSVTVLRDGQGRPVNWVAIIENMDQRHRSDERFQRLTDELRRSNQELEQFSYVVSHDLQEPLRMVASFVSLLKRRYGGKLDHEADEYIQFAVDGAQRMQQMIVDLLDYSRVTRKGQPFEPVSLDQALADALNNLKMSIQDTGAQVTAEPLPQVLGDGSQMLRLFQNLVGNALKYRRPDEPPRIAIKARQVGLDWVVEVADNGIGIAPEYFERIFQIFQRLHGRGEYEGTGIGLAVCRRIVERHRGRIWVESVPGQGSRFLFTLPVESVRAQPAPAD